MSERPHLLSCRAVGKLHRSVSGKTAAAVRAVTFDLAAGEFLSVVGPSGSGKSTLLNLIAGVYPPTEGAVVFPQPNPKIGYVLQANSLFPWMTVRRNLSYAYEILRRPRGERDAVASRLAEQLGLAPGEFLDKYPRELSGGEQRRVAIGMAVAVTPDLLLLDEPGSQLDYEAQWAVQALIQRVALNRKMAVICVTHDIEEAVFLGDRVMVLKGGQITDMLDIDLERPRAAGVRASDEFNRYRRLLMADGDGQARGF